MDAGSGLDVPLFHKGSVKPRSRPKESAAKRRGRRLRAEMRTYDRLVRAAQAVCSHHLQDSVLALCIRAFFSDIVALQLAIRHFLVMCLHRLRLSAWRCVCRSDS